ncbi:MAG TPA: alkaline phosphatase family protein, partial [Vicinamibacterales bacterium]
MRRACAALMVVTAIALPACTAPPADAGRPKLVILGFDGLDPDLVQQYVKARQMPTFARLMARGGLYPLETTVSPESPTAWASFATGVNPGKHNIYDFLVRDTSTYLPDLGMVRREPPKFLFDWIPIKRPKVISLRGGTSFWVTAGRAGVRSSVLTVPMTFPPEEVPNGELLSGLPLPDLRGTMGTFHYFATDLSRYEEGNTEFGGILRRLVFEGNTAHTQLVGPPNPIVRMKTQAIRRKGPLSDADRTALAELEAQEDVTLPLTVTWTRGSGKADIDINGQRVTLKTGEWSKWITLDFTVNLFVRLHGMAQLYLTSADRELQLYVSPINFKPDVPPVPMSAPAGFAADIYRRLGPYRTLGWAEATWPLNEGRMDEKTFMDDLYRAFDDRAQVILDRLSRSHWDLLVGVIESTDRVQHMMYRLIDPAHPMYDAALAARFGDSILRVYRRADQFVGQVMELVGQDTTVLIVSDHGFHSFRKAVNLNTWLV